MNKLREFMDRHKLSSYQAARLLGLSQSKAYRRSRKETAGEQIDESLRVFGMLPEDVQQLKINNAKGREQ